MNPHAVVTKLDIDTMTKEDASDLHQDAKVGARYAYWLTAITGLVLWLSGVLQPAYEILPGYLVAPFAVLFF
ncbi:MAG: hypothetical protein GY822_14950 [Deltaproteobacteria bacterium]|nr:hypothetical protein [Deltaproteobacteria bacterium]